MLQILAVLVGIIILLIGAFTTQQHPIEGGAPTRTGTFFIANASESDPTPHFLRTHDLRPTRSQSSATLVWLHPDARRYPSRVSHIRSAIKNTLDIRALLTNRAELWSLVSQHCPDQRAHFAPTWSLRSFQWQEGKYIVQRADTTAPRNFDPRIVTSRKELDAICATLTRDNILDQAVISEYFDNPQLIAVGQHQHKFYLRVYVLITSQGIILHRDRAFAEIGIAAKPYEQDHYRDPDIHDANIAQRKPFSEPLEQSAQIADICRALTTIVRATSIQPYPESKDGFEVLALDLLPVLRDAPTLILLGVHRRAEPLNVSREYLQWVWECGIAPILEAKK